MHSLLTGKADVLFKVCERFRKLDVKNSFDFFFVCRISKTINPIA
jgi:hypothetical protein